MDKKTKEIYKLFQNLVNNLISWHKKKNALTKALKLSPQLKLDISIAEINLEISKIQEVLLELSIILKIDLDDICYDENLSNSQLEFLEKAYLKSNNKLYHSLYRKKNV